MESLICRAHSSLLVGGTTGIAPRLETIIRGRESFLDKHWKMKYIRITFQQISFQEVLLMLKEIGIMEVGGRMYLDSL